VALRWRLAPLESFARAVGNLCFVYAFFYGLFLVWHAGWAILAKLGPISTPWPFNNTASIIIIALGAPIAVTAVTAGYGPRQLRSYRGNLHHGPAAVDADRVVLGTGTGQLARFESLHPLTIETEPCEASYKSGYSYWAAGNDRNARVVSRATPLFERRGPVSRQSPNGSPRIDK